MSQQQEQCYLMACLHKVSGSMLRQLCDDASNSVLIEINRVVQKWVAAPFWSVITELLKLNVELGSVYIKC